MTPQKLETLFAHVNGTTFVALDLATMPRITNSPLAGRVIKYTRGMQVMVFSDPAYERLVKRRLMAEGKDASKFQVSPRTWGERRKNAPFVDHQGAVYLECIVLRPGTIEYKLDGLPLIKEQIEGLADDRPSPTGVEIRCIHSDSITKVVINGMSYK
jgi:hypothetical protein